MSSLHQSRARVLFDVACAFGFAASSAFAWTQTYATAFLPMAGIAALYGVVRLSDMRRGFRDDVEETVVVKASAPKPIRVFEPEQVPVDPPTFVQPPMEDVLATVKRGRKSTKPAKVKKAPVPDVAEPAAFEPLPVAQEPATFEPLPVAEEPATIEPEVPLVLDQTTAEVVQHPARAAADESEPEPDYAPPVVPLFEAEPFVRTQRRAAFGRKSG